MNVDEHREQKAREIFNRRKALAFIRRAKEAQIPEKFMRVKESDFRKIVFDDYYGGKEKASQFVESIFKSPGPLRKMPFITIDGGSEINRRKAGFAILFRLITTDMFGFSENCDSIYHKLQTISSPDGFNRNDITDSLKSYDALFISEFQSSVFRPHWDGGDFFDEFLRYRSDNLKPTIISFFDSISRKPSITDRRCGEYLATLSIKEQPTEEIVRVRVKV